jgi:hypothetical protein
MVQTILLFRQTGNPLGGSSSHIPFLLSKAGGAQYQFRQFRCSYVTGITAHRKKVLGESGTPAWSGVSEVGLNHIPNISIQSDWTDRRHSFSISPAIVGLTTPPPGRTQINHKT